MAVTALCTFVGLFTLAPVLVSGQRNCDDTEVIICLEPMLTVYRNISSDLLSGEINLVELSEICPQYRDYQQCAQPRCLVPLFKEIHQLMTDVFDYICDDIFADIQRYRSCWSDPDLRTDYAQCGEFAAQKTISTRDPCSFYREMEGCLGDVTRNSCGQEPNSLLQGFLAISNARQKSDLQCLAETPVNPGPRPNQNPVRQPNELPRREPVPRESGPPTDPELPVRCWECNSGESRDSNPLCPISGNLEASLLTSITCRDPCFVRTDQRNREIVHRGCSTGWYFPEDLERRGCIENPDGVVWCFCDTDKCNTQDMAAFLNEPL